MAIRDDLRGHITAITLLLLSMKMLSLLHVPKPFIGRSILMPAKDLVISRMRAQRRRDGRRLHRPLQIDLNIRREPSGSSRPLLSRLLLL